MDAQNLHQVANEAARKFSSGFGEVEGKEAYSVVEVRTTYNGHAVTLSFTDHSSDPPAYRYNLAVVDAETGEVVATGNGGASWDEALSIVHWQELDLHFRQHDKD